MAGDTLDLTLTFAELGDFTLTLPIMDIETGMDMEHQEGEEDAEEGEHQEGDEHEEEGEHQEGEEHGEGMDMGDHDEYVKSVVVVGGECEGVTEVMVVPNTDMENVVDLTFMFEDGDELSVSVPVITALGEMEGMDGEMESGGNG
jgi:hypothetical protein